MFNKCKGLQQDLVNMRRELHKVPELGLDLPYKRGRWKLFKKYLLSASFFCNFFMFPL